MEGCGSYQSSRYVDSYFLHLKLAKWYDRVLRTSYGYVPSTSRAVRLSMHFTANLWTDPFIAHFIPLPLSHSSPSVRAYRNLRTFGTPRCRVSAKRALKVGARGILQKQIKNITLFLHLPLLLQTLIPTVNGRRRSLSWMEEYRSLHARIRILWTHIPQSSSPISSL